MRKTKSVLALFENNEKAVVTLYRVYRRYFPDQIATWKKMCKEEVKHVEILKNLRIKYPNDGEYFTLSPFALEAITKVEGFIREQMSSKILKNLSPQEALETALRIERSMAEKKYFSLYNPEILEVRQAFRRLNRDVDRHIRILMKALVKI
jgi:hypothetical protein